MVQGKQISACSWEGGSLRIALAVDSFIYFANIRPDYKWTYFASTVVYSHTKPDRQDTAITFWNTKTGDKYQKHVRSLLSVSSQGEHCVLATKNDDNINPYGLILCNSLGSDWHKVNFNQRIRCYSILGNINKYIIYV